MGTALKRSTLIAAAVLAVLAGVAYWLERGDGTAGDETLFGVSENEITRVEIRVPDEPAVVVARGPDGFRVTAPIEAEADASEVELLLANLATMRAIRTLDRDAERDAAEFGLDTPKLEVVFDVEEGTTPKGLRFGNDTLTPSNQYARRIGAPEVLVVGSYASNALTKSGWDLRDKRIFRIPETAEPTRVVITRDDETIEMERADGRWHSRTGLRARLEPSEITGMVWAFRNASMLSLEEWHEESPAGRLEIAFDGGERLVLELGRQRKVDYVARVPGRAESFMIEGGLVDTLHRGLPELWSKALLDVSPAAVTSVRIGTRTLEREASETLAGALFSTRAEAVVPTRPSGNPALVATFSTADGEETLSFYETTDAALATRENEDVSLRLSSEAWQEIASLVGRM